MRSIRMLLAVSLMVIPKAQIVKPALVSTQPEKVSVQFDVELEDPPSTQGVLVSYTPQLTTPIPVVPSPTPQITPIPAQNTPQEVPEEKTYDLSSIKEIAQELCNETFGNGQFIYLDHIITAESGWNYRATEKRTGAYGLGQALPAGKMDIYGSDFLTNPVTQIKWMLAYIKNRYGTPENAWIFHLKMGWY